MNRKINKLLYEDQRDRRRKKPAGLSLQEWWSLIKKRDNLRIKKISNILQETKKFTGLDYFKAGVIFQHGGKISSFKRAQKLAKIGTRLGHKKCRWLYAAATDRILVQKKKKQKFGTQFFKDNKGIWKLFPVDKKTTDVERKKYSVSPLGKITKYVESLNSPRGKEIIYSRKIGITRK